MSSRGSKNASPNTLLLAAGAAVSALGLGYLAYRFFAPKPAFDEKMVILVLNEIGALYAEASESLEDERQEVIRRAQSASPEQARELQRHLVAMVHKLAHDHMHVIFDKHGITQEELNEAVEKYKDNPSVAFLVNNLPSINDVEGDDDEEEEVDDSELPDLETVVQAMSTVLELSISDMESVFPKLASEFGSEASPSGLRLQSNPAFANALARAYTQQHQESRKAALAEMGLTERVLGRAARKHSDSEELREVVMKHVADKRKRFTALGLMKQDDNESAGASGAKNNTSDDDDDGNAENSESGSSGARGKIVEMD